MKWAVPRLQTGPVTVDHLLQTIPPVVVYLLTGVVIGLESLGIPLPGEIVLVECLAALVAARARRVAGRCRGGRVDRRDRR